MSRREIIAVLTVAGVLLLAAVGILQITGVSHKKLLEFVAMGIGAVGIALVPLILLILVLICLRLFGRKK